MQFAKLAVKYMIFRLFSAIFAEMLDNIYIYIYIYTGMYEFTQFQAEFHTFFILWRLL